MSFFSILRARTDETAVRFLHEIEAFVRNDERVAAAAASFVVPASAEVTAVTSLSQQLESVLQLMADLQAGETRDEAAAQTSCGCCCV